jgi:hypothetical protein
MKFLPNTFAILCLFFSAPLAKAGDAVLGAETTFESYYGVVEKCVRILPMPGGEYDKDDIKEEVDFCAIDFYSRDIALCPKIWSTSAAVVIYDLTSGRFEGERTRFQEIICEGGKIAKYVAKDDLGKLKFTMNQETTSGVSSISSLLYYHFSRYFDMSTKVPVAVWRSIDANVLLNEVVLGGVYLTRNNAHLTRNNAAWNTLADIIDDPSSYIQPGSFGRPEDLITTDGEKLYGALLNGSGQAWWGPEIDISINSPWTAPTYDDLQKTPTFTALASDAPLDLAILFSLREGMGNFSEELNLAARFSAQQLAFSMRDLSEVLLIDFIMAQQDRLHNIEYRPYFYWMNNGLVVRARTKDHTAGDGVVPEDAVQILRMRLNDNDTGGRDEYDNHTMLFGMLEKLRHFDAKIYRRLIELDADFQSGGPIYTWLANSLGLRNSKMQMIVGNTALAAEILRSTCEAGALRFDLEPKQFFANGHASEEVQACTLDNIPPSAAGDSTTPSEE